MITKQSTTASQARCDLHAYAKRVEKFWMVLTKYPWIELLIAITHEKGRRPTKLELLFINKIIYIIKVYIKGHIVPTKHHCSKLLYGHMNVNIKVKINIKEKTCELIQSIR